jgi:hypothetical protein
VQGWVLQLLATRYIISNPWLITIDQAPVTDNLLLQVSFLFAWLFNCLLGTKPKQSTELVRAVCSLCDYSKISSQSLRQNTPLKFQTHPFAPCESAPGRGSNLESQTHSLFRKFLVTQSTLRLNQASCSDFLHQPGCFHRLMLEPWHAYVYAC